MKRYKLKKDLPTFKAGSEFELDRGLWYKKDERGNAVISELPICAYTQQTLDKFPSILKDWFEEIPERPKTVWDLEKGDKCWIVRCSDCSAPYADRYTWYGDDMLRHFRDMGELFLTEQEAERHIERSKARAILLRDTKGFKPDYGSHSHGHQVYLIDGELEIDYCPFQDGTIRFATEEDAEESIDKHRKEWLTYLGVEDETV